MLRLQPRPHFSGGFNGIEEMPPSPRRRPPSGGLEEVTDAFVPDPSTQCLRMVGTDNERALQIAGDSLGINIHAIPGLTDGDLRSFLFGLFGHSRNIPPDTQHLIVGHGYGQGRDWRFFTGEGVQDYVNRTIPRGEAAWAVVCETGNARKMSLLEGKRVVSQE